MKVRVGLWAGVALVVGACGQAGGTGSAPAASAAAATAIPSAVAAATRLPNRVRLTRAGDHFVILADGQAFLEGGVRREIAGRAGPSAAIREAITSSTGPELVYVAIAEPGSVNAFESGDAARTWGPAQRQTLTDTDRIGGVWVAQVGDRLTMLLVEATSTAFSTGRVATAALAGAPWVVRPAPVGGTIASAGGRFWITGGVMGDQVFVSTDGLAWQRVRIPATRRSWTAAPPAAVDGLGVVIPVTSHDPGGPSELVFLATANSGATWDALTSVTAPPTESATSIPTSITSDGHWVAIWPDGSKVLTGSLASDEHVTISPNGLPANVTEVVFTSATSGVAASQVASCPTGKASCTSWIVVSRTDDGGQNWSPLAFGE